MFRLQSRSAYRVFEIVQDIRELAEALGHPKFVLVAHDWGAVAAWQFAAYHQVRPLLSAPAEQLAKNVPCHSATPAVSSAAACHQACHQRRAVSASRVHSCDRSHAGPNCIVRKMRRVLRISALLHVQLQDERKSQHAMRIRLSHGPCDFAS